MGLSAWKVFGGARWALRVNPSSGNLHPTEAYIVRNGSVCHYAPAEHGLELRSALPPEAWRTLSGGREGFLVALTSIPWREAWKYGERAFRYCQHDVGHAIGALRFAAALVGWTVTPLPRWSDEQLAALVGLGRNEDGSENAEREEPEYMAVVGAEDAPSWMAADPAALVGAARAATWQGTANQLSPRHIDWPIIDRVSDATRCPGRGDSGLGTRDSETGSTPNARLHNSQRAPVPIHGTLGVGHATDVALRQLLRAPRAPSRGGSWELSAGAVILQRRSAVAFDARSALPRPRFFSMLSRLQPHAPPWDAIDWPPHVHLAVFVHRVDGLTPGVYAYLRDATVLNEWRAAMRPAFLWEHVPTPPSPVGFGEAGGPNVPNDPNGLLFLLLPCDVTRAAKRISCDQDIAGDGFFSLGMIARVGSSLRDRGEWFYRRLFWECGLVGQVLYLEAEGAGARGTGIGCFFDDAVHDLLGLSGGEWQSLYHFSMGMPVEDERLTTEPGYSWE